MASSAWPLPILIGPCYSGTPGLALSVQPTGHRAWKCIYTAQRRPRWVHLGNARAIPLADARRLAARIMIQAAEGKDPYADRLALRNRGSFEQVASRVAA